MNGKNKMPLFQTMVDEMLRLFHDVPEQTGQNISQETGDNQQNESVSSCEVHPKSYVSNFWGALYYLAAVLFIFSKRIVSKIWHCAYHRFQPMLYA